MPKDWMTDTATDDKQPPSRWQALLDRLMGRSVLQQAAGSATPPASSPNQDTSIVRKAAEEAAARMEAAKKVNGGKEPKQYACGGVVGFMGKETKNWRYGR